MSEKWFAILAMVSSLALTGCAAPGGGEGEGEGEGEAEVLYSAVLAGASERPTPVTTTTTGSAEIEYHPDEAELHVFLTVNGGVGITAAHIHLGGPEATGDVAATLFASSDATNGEDIDATLAEVILTEADLSGTTMADLIATFDSDGAYVNVHSAANPEGEVRGQITPDA